jgi:hypothetical protein
MTRSKLLEQLKIYFEKKGKILTPEEYKAADDAPYRFQVVKRTVGSWARLKNLTEKPERIKFNGLDEYDASELEEVASFEPEATFEPDTILEPGVTESVKEKNGK